MYNILIVDDEPLICEGLTQLLFTSGIDINHIYNANSGYEALDYLRMEDIDLLVTDIQMGTMSGIELMQQAKIIKPWVEVIIISAHETFQYAQLAIRFGAKDYLIKPLSSEQFLSSVRHVLLHIDKTARDQDQLMSDLSDSFRMREPLPVRTALLNRLLARDATDRETIVAELSRQHGVDLGGPYYAVIKVRLDLESGGRDISQKDGQLLQYAVLNIAGELLDKEWDHQSFYDADGTVCIVIQWDEARYGDSSVDKVNQLEMIGRSLHFNVHKFLGFGCVVGISQILKGAGFLGEVHEQANKAMLWSRQFKDHYVFYYGDFKWGVYSEEEPTEDEITAQNNLIVERSSKYIHQNYAQKGLTLNEIAQKNHVSPNYLSYLFKKKTGYNLWEYVIKLRMEESKRLILNTDLRRYEISELVGYESPEHFSKIFKKYFGMSPSEMKK
ncbi:response regulator [Paenibacillus sp. LHD-117]|uniref:response regulator transcription factor n=1 Tax=Paenibacillus sp. LHD-117 TaxID=3071412 RepID=UPI0027E039C9|nr:response regulator [Paenibacillus sp. LHD-117]MDQ6420271.1 response regulator [Paenibacillus sp. LHD-117]